MRYILPISKEIKEKIAKANLKEKRVILNNIMINYYTTFCLNESNSDFNREKEIEKITDEMRKVFISCIYTKNKINVANFVKVIDGHKAFIFKGRDKELDKVYPHDFRSLDFRNYGSTVDALYKVYQQNDFINMDIFNDVMSKDIYTKIFNLIQSDSKVNKVMTNLILVLGFFCVTPLHYNYHISRNEIYQLLVKFNYMYNKTLYPLFGNDGLNENKLQAIYLLSGLQFKYITFQNFTIDFYHNTNFINISNRYTFLSNYYGSNRFSLILSLFTDNQKIIYDNLSSKKVDYEYLRYEKDLKLISLTDRKILKFLINKNLLSITVYYKLVFEIANTLYIHRFLNENELIADCVSKSDLEKSLKESLLNVLDLIISKKKLRNQFLSYTLNKDYIYEEDKIINNLITEHIFDEVNNENKDYINIASEIMERKLNE